MKLSASLVTTALCLLVCGADSQYNPYDHYDPGYGYAQGYGYDGRYDYEDPYYNDPYYPVDDYRRQPSHYADGHRPSRHERPSSYRDEHRNGDYRRPNGYREDDYRRPSYPYREDNYRRPVYPYREDDDRRPYPYREDDDRRPYPYGKDRYPYRRPDDFNNESLRKPSSNQDDFDKEEAMDSAKKVAQSTRKVAALVDSVKNTRGSGSILKLFGQSSSDASKFGSTLGDISSAIKGVANLMEQGAGAAIDMRETLSSL